MSYSGSRAATSRHSLTEREWMARATAQLEIRRRAQRQERIEIHDRLIDYEVLDLVPALTPTFERPEHLAPIASFFDRVNRGEVVRSLVSAPPQFGKSKLMGFGVAQYIARTPERPVIYASYGADLAEQKSREARDLCAQLDVELRPDAAAVATWLTPEGGGLRARGIGGSTTGNPAKLFVVDDPHKDREEAESALLRQKVFDWYTSVAETRCHPDSSILVAHTRWHEDDLIGQLSRLVHPRTGKPMFEHYNLPAILPDGTPLWHQRPIEWLEPKQQFEHDWWSLWMGQPRKLGARLFKGISYYDRLPARYRVGKGLDLAYTAKKKSHRSVGVVLLEDLESPANKPVFYVTDVRAHRGHLIAPKGSVEEDFVSKISSVVWPGTWHWFTSVQEKGVALLLGELQDERKIYVEAVLAAEDKFARAQAVAAAWNDGRVLVPREAPWLKEFVDEIGSFSGVSDKADDQVDALASAFEGVRYRGGGAKPVGGSGSRYGEERGFG
jgi:hypothetical protein